MTANQLVDWCWPSDPKQHQRLRKSELLPWICHHLADGAKHFLLDRPHRGLQRTGRHDGAFDPAVFSDACDIAELVVDLQPVEAAELKQDRITVYALATLVVEYWRHCVGRK